MLRRFLTIALAAILLAFALPLPTRAQTSAPTNPSPRAALHDGFGRMVFDWDGPVNYSADVINGELVVRFDRPVKGEFRSVLRPLAKYIRGVSVSADKKTASFPLIRPVAIKAFVNANNAVVVDLVDPDGNAQNEPDDRPTASKPAVPAQNVPNAKDAKEGGAVPLLPQGRSPRSQAASLPPAPVPARPSAGASTEAPTVDVRAGEHGAFNRLVFDFPHPTAYRVEKEGNRAIISFAKPARLNLKSLASTLPSDISLVTSEAGGAKPTVALNIPADARLRHFVSGTKVVVDVVRAAGAPTPPGSPSAALASGSDVHVPALQPLGPAEKVPLPSETLAALPNGPSPVKPIPEPNAKSQAGMPAPASAGPAGGSRAGGGPDKVFSLSVAWDKPVAAAVFQRAGYLWVVFDRHQEVDTKLLRRLGGEAVSAVDQLAVRDATVLRLLVQPDFTPSLRRDGLLWVIDLANQPAVPSAPIKVTAPATLPGGIGMTLGVAEAGNVVMVQDPEVGDAMIVVPVIPLGAAVYPGRETPDLRLLPTFQGIAIIPRADGLEVKSSRSGVTIAMPAGAGLRLSAEASKPQGTKTEMTGGFFDVPGWMRGGPDHFETERRIVEGGLVNLPAARRGMAHLQAARFYFANGYGAEALGYLRMAAAEEPALAETGAFRALRGACQVLMGHWDAAQADLDNPLLKDDPESQFWRAAAHAGAGDAPGDQAANMALGLPLLKEYPRPLKWPLASLAVVTAVAAGDDGAAQEALDILDRAGAAGMEQGQLDYLHGIYDEMAGQFDKALDDYDRAATGDNREYRARGALAATELRLKMKKISSKEAAEKLDHLRFSWREENFEFGLLRRYAELQADAGDYPDALRALRSLTSNYSNNKGAPAVAKLMTDVFTKLYLDGAADGLSPVSALGLYDEFRDLTPPGPKGDEMIRKLADRLAAVDLLDRAAELLKHQVAFRLQGVDKARVGAQLALLDLLNKKPDGALDALQSSDMNGLPDDLLKQRRHLKARALADVDRVQEAIQLLVGDQTPEAAMLRAEIYWNKKDWPDAAAAFESMVPRPDRGTTLDDASARLVLSWATALTLGNDERSLAALRRTFGAAMAGTAYKDGFLLLTSAVDRDLPDMPAVAAKIKEAEGFQSFMSKYKKRLQSSGLSSIN